LVCLLYDAGGVPLVMRQPVKFEYRRLPRVDHWLMVLLFRFPFHVDLILRVLEDGLRYIGFAEACVEDV
jgi:hypothetical protein